MKNNVTGKWILYWSVILTASCIVLSFPLYLLLFSNEFADKASLLRQTGPGPRLLLFPVFCILLLCVIAHFRHKKGKTLRLPHRYPLSACATFTVLYIFFTCLHYAYLILETSTTSQPLPILLGGPSFLLMLGMLFISVLLPFLNYLLYAESLCNSVRYFLHGTLLIFLLVVLFVVLYGGFSSFAYGILFVLSAALVYSVFALIHHTYTKQKGIASEKEYKNIYH